MDRLEAMRLFVRVADLGSFAAVAQQEGVARSVITRQVAALEARLGCKLMARSTRRLTLTSAGAAFIEKCRVILNLVDAAETDIAAEHQSPRGNIRVSVPLSFGLKRLAPLLLEFARRYPDVALDMEYSDRRGNLIEEGIDLSIRVTSRLAAGDVARKLGVSHMKVVAAPQYLAQHGRPKLPADVAQHEFLGYTYAGAGGIEFQVGDQRQKVDLRGRLNANNGEVLAEAAAQGMASPASPISSSTNSSPRAGWSRSLATTRCPSSASTRCCPATARSRIACASDGLPRRPIAPGTCCSERFVVTGSATAVRRGGGHRGAGAACFSRQVI